MSYASFSQDTATYWYNLITYSTEPVTEGDSLNNKFRISNNQLKDQYVENLTIKTYYTVSSV